MSQPYERSEYCGRWKQSQSFQVKIRLNTRAAVKAYMPFPVVNTVITKDLTIDTDQEMEECRECDLSIEYIFFYMFFQYGFCGQKEWECLQNYGPHKCCSENGGLWVTDIKCSFVNRMKMAMKIFQSLRILIFKNGRLMTSKCIFMFKSTSIEESKSVLWADVSRPQARIA